MNIGIDHGYYAIKTRHFSFPAGIAEYSHEPYTLQNTLEFGGKFYVCGTGRQPILRNKMENDNYYLLTLAAIAKEIKQRGGKTECSVRIAAGLPLAGFGREKKPFREYLLRSSQPVCFKFEGIAYKITIEDVKLFPQGYSAIALHPELIQNEPSVLLMDIGGWTVDLMRLDNGVPNAFRFDRKYATMILPGTGRTVRFKTLGKNYTPEAIQNRILYPKPPHRAGKQTPPASRFLILLGEKPPRRISGLRALYYSYLYKMGALPKKPRYPSFAVRQDIRKLDQRIEQAEFIFKNHIEDRGQLRAIRQKAEDEIAVLLKARQKLYRYQPDSPQIGILTEQLKKQRHIVKLCRNIETHSIEMEQHLQAAQQEEQQRQEKQAQEEKNKQTRNRENQKRR